MCIRDRPYTTLYQSEVKKQPVSYKFNAEKLTGEFEVKYSLWYSFSLKEKCCDLFFSTAELPIPVGMEATHITMQHNHKYLTLKLYPTEMAMVAKKAEEVKPDNRFELELWTWDEPELCIRDSICSAMTVQTVGET